jgi:hypothetical protein
MNQPDCMMHVTCCCCHEPASTWKGKGNAMCVHGGEDLTGRLAGTNRGHGSSTTAIIQHVPATLPLWFGGWLLEPGSTCMLHQRVECDLELLHFSQLGLAWHMLTARDTSLPIIASLHAVS